MDFLAKVRNLQALHPYASCTAPPFGDLRIHGSPTLMMRRCSCPDLLALACYLVGNVHVNGDLECPHAMRSVRLDLPWI